MEICCQYSWLPPVPFEQKRPQSALSEDGPNTLSNCKAPHQECVRMSIAGLDSPAQVILAHSVLF